MCDDANTLLSVSCVWRGEAILLRLHRAATAADAVAALLEARPDLESLGLECTLISSGAKLQPDQSLFPPSHAPSSTLRVLVHGSLGSERVSVASAPAAPRLRDDLDAGSRARQGAGHLRGGAAAAAPALPLHGGSHVTGDLHGFGEIRVLPLPDADAAREVLERVARDPGVRAVMKARRWHVPVLAELYPDGKVGIDPVCVLGLNENKGAAIKLRVRTDDLRGMRKFAIVMATVWHELAHNAISEHTAEFYALVSELKRDGERLDWTKTNGKTIGHETVFRREDDLGTRHAAAALFDGGVLGGSAARSRLLDEADRINVGARDSLHQTEPEGCAHGECTQKLEHQPETVVPPLGRPHALPQIVEGNAAAAAAENSLPRDLVDAVESRRRRIREASRAVPANLQRQLHGIVERALRGGAEKYRTIKLDALARLAGDAASLAVEVLVASGFVRSSGFATLVDFAAASIALEAILR